MKESWETPEQEDCKRKHAIVQEKQGELMYALEGRRADITAGNRGDADQWIRHIDAAYLAYSEACDDWADARDALKEAKLKLVKRTKEMRGIIDG
ncbi:hypothetical protein VPHD433_0026 [Vibrio phage D433]